MNPLCLLNKGKSVKDIEHRPGAYKLLANTAPKFQAGKRGAQQAPPPALEPAQKSLFDQPNPVVNTPSPVVEAAKAAAPVAPVVSKSPFAPGAEQARKTSGLESWKKAFSWLHGSVWAKKKGPVRASTVQPELALDRVTVLRNDLNEDDLEVVLVERKVGTGEKPLARISKMEMTAEAWLKLTAPFRKKNGESAINPKAGTEQSPELSART